MDGENERNEDEARSESPASVSIVAGNGDGTSANSGVTGNGTAPQSAPQSVPAEITIQVSDALKISIESKQPAPAPLPALTEVKEGEEAASSTAPAATQASVSGNEDEAPSDDESENSENSESSDEEKERSISSDLIRGHINTIILRALDDGDKYGYEIISEIEKKSHGQYSMKQPSLYSALKRLEKDGFITSYWGGSVGGGRRKYFSLTDEGKEISSKNRSEWEYSRTVIDSLISDRDFDFSQPAPTQVNMRVLRSSTSRVPNKEESEEEFALEESALRERLLEEQTRIEEELHTQREQFEAEKQRISSEHEAEKQRLITDYEDEKQRLALEYGEEKRRWIAEREEEKLQREAQFEAEKQQLSECNRQLNESNQRLKETLEARESLLAEERERQAAILAEQERVLEAEKSEKTANAEEFAAREAERDRQIEQREEQIEAERKAYLDEIAARQTELMREREASEKRRAAQEAQLLEERAKTSRLEADHRMALEEERRRHLAELEEAHRTAQANLEAQHRNYLMELERQKQQIEAEQEARFRERERDLIHQNYLNLVNAPPEPPRPQEYTYYSTPAEPVQAPEESEVQYQTVIERLYRNSVKPEAPRTADEPKKTGATPLEGVSYTDLEALAAHDGIRITTAGMKKTQEEVLSERVFHKGKALFLSALVVFVVCLIEGSIVLGLQQQYDLPLFFPYFIYGTGLALLLVLGVAYANRYGERAIRRNANLVPVNGTVIYILLVIATLILALAIQIDFTAPHDLATYVIIPIVFFFNVVIFAVAYFLQIRPKKD